MLKRTIGIVLSLILVCSLCACGVNTQNELKNDTSGNMITENNDTTENLSSETPTTDKEKESDDDKPESQNALLITYFSWSGNSKAQAELIQEQTNGTLFEIAREEAYPEDYTECTEVAKVEADHNERPAIKNPLDSVEEYEKIVVCYPIWWHTAPMCVGTFLESYDLTGKTIYPISQSASMDVSQYEQSVQFIKDCAKAAMVDSGIFSKDDSEISNYITEIVLK